VNLQTLQFGKNSKNVKYLNGLLTSSEEVRVREMLSRTVAKLLTELQRNSHEFRYAVIRKRK
jgi:hypothetical protein